MLWLILGLGLVTLLVLLKTFLGRLRKGLEEAVSAKLGSTQSIRTDTGANFFGLTSKGMGQVRGNGALVLTSRELFFIMAIPRREIVIPLNSITSLSLKKSHLGKTIAYPLLRVDFSTFQGSDSAAWAISKPEEWKAAVEATMKNAA